MPYITVMVFQFKYIKSNTTVPIVSKNGDIYFSAYDVFLE